MSQHQTFGRADLHMHTDASDGKPGVKALLDFVARQRSRLDAIAITDHDTLDSSLYALEHQHLYPFEIIPGVEVSSVDGHILALWVTQPIPTYLDLTETVAAIHEAGGIAILAHPVHPLIKKYRRKGVRNIRKPSVLVEAKLDAIEAHNAGIGGLGFNWIARSIAHKIGLPVIGGSDAHTLGAIGTGLTLYPGRTAADLRQALEKCATLARGTSWRITDYVEYAKHNKQRKAMISLASMNSSAPLNR